VWTDRHCIQQAIASLVSLANGDFEHLLTASGGQKYSTFAAVARLCEPIGLSLRKVRIGGGGIQHMLLRKRGRFLLQVVNSQNTREHVVAYDARYRLLMDAWTNPHAYRVHCRKHCDECKRQLLYTFDMVTVGWVRQICRTGYRKKVKKEAS
jgi:hypothetical protein